MVKKASQKPIETELRAILNAIAAPADVQIELYGDVCVAHALSGRYEYVSGRLLRSRTSKPTAEHRKALEDLAARFAKTDEDPAHECYDEAYIEGSPLWSDVRESAARALRAFGWPPGTPAQRTTVIKTVEPHMDDVPRSRRVRPHWVKRWSGTDTNLKYHRALFEMLDIEPVVSKPFAQIVAEREHALGRALPPSIAELLRLRDIFDLFEQNSNQDGLIGWIFGADDRTRLRALGNPRHVEQGYLQVAVENQGAVTWFARLDGSDDPPVYHDNDMSASDGDLSEVIWTLVAPTFSIFLFEMMSLWRFRAPQYRLEMRATASRPTEQDRQRLQSLLRVGPSDERDGVFIDRYFTPHGLLKVSHDEPLEEGQAVWHVQADSLDVLDTFLAVLAPIGTLTRHFELEVWPESLRADAQARLDRFRAG
jgi:hypothetical protein